MKFFIMSILGLLIIGLFTACDAGDKTVFFKGKNALLEQAINQDNAEAVVQAIKQGADPNAVGLHGVTPIIVTSGNLKFNAMKALLKHGANPNTYDDNGDNAVTLASQTYITGDKRYLEFLLDNGGDPNSKLPDKDPLFTRIALLRDTDSLRYLVDKGADINVYTRTGKPLISFYSLINDWDITWTLLELGAKFKYNEPGFSIARSMKDPTEIPPGSPQFDYKEKVWEKLCKNGVKVPPLTTKETWDWYYQNKPNRPDYEMPLISCNHENKKIIGEWDGKKPKVVSAYDGLKARGEL